MSWNPFAAAPVQSTPATTPAGNPAPAPSPATPANTDAFNPNHTTDPQNKTTPTAPLAEFGDLFKVDESKPTEEDSPFAWNYDPQKLNDTIAGLTFVDPAQAAELATSMGVQNPEAFANFMNTFGRTIYQQSLLVNSKMSEQSVNIAEQRFTSKVPTHIRNSMVNNEITSQDTNSANPALTPIINMVSAQIAQKNPSFTPEQVAEHTRNYMAGVAQVYAPKPKTLPNNQLNAPADFSGFFNQ